MISKPFAFSRIAAIATAALFAVSPLAVYAAVGLVAAPSPCDVTGTPFLTINQNITNDPDSGNHGNWATDAFTEVVNVWVGTDGTTYCANANATNATFVTTGPLSPEAGFPLAAGITGTFTGGENYTFPAASVTLNPLYSTTSPQTVSFPDSSTAGFSTWAESVFGVPAGTGSSYVNTYSLTYVTPSNGTWTDGDPASGGDAGDIGSIYDVTSGMTYATIQAAVDAAGSGDTIKLAAGTYDAFSIANKTGITITGAGKTATFITPTTLIATGITHKYTANATASVLVNNSTNVLIQNLAITSTSQAPGSGGADAVVLWNASSGTIKNAAIAGTYTINGAQTGQGIAVDASAAQNSALTVDTVDISGFQKNGIDAINGNGATSGATGSVTVTVKNGTLTGAGPIATIAQNGMVLWNRGGGVVQGSIDGTTISGFNYSPNTDTAAGVLAYGGGQLTSIHNATFGANQIHLSTTAGSPAIDGTLNYWGSAAGPDAVNTLDGVVTYSPWYTDALKTTLSFVTATTSATTTATTAGATTLTSTTTAPVVVTATIPSGTTITGDASWNGVVTPPSATTVTITAAPGFNANVTSAIAIGSSLSDLTFDKAVQLIFPGQAGTFVGWYDHAGVFSGITTTCADNTQTTNNTLPAGTSCKINVGSDLVVWTKHFSTFVTYTQTLSGGAGGSGSGSSGGGSGSISVTSTPVVTTSTTTPVVAPAVPTVTSGEVLGAEAYNFSKTLTFGSRGTDVTELHKILIAAGYLKISAPTGYFGPLTKAAVMAYQKANKVPATGVVAALTRAQLNKGALPTKVETTTTATTTASH